MSNSDSIDLWFPLQEVITVAEHAMTARKHSRCPFADDEVPTAPSLIWTKNDGTYLWSNGVPRQQRDPRRPGFGPAVGACPGLGTGHWARGRCDSGRW